MEAFRSYYPEIVDMWEKKDTPGLIDVLSREDVVLKIETARALADLGDPLAAS